MMKVIKISKEKWIQNDSIKAYFRMISKFKVLNPEEEAELAESMASGDEKAKNELIKANLRFVCSVAKSYLGNGMPIEDLVQAGNRGLIKATETFDPTRGFRFVSYAVFFIRRAIIEEILEHGSCIRKPNNTYKELHAIDKLEAKFEQENLRLPSEEELLDLLDDTVWDEHKLSRILQSRHSVVSMESTVAGTEDLRYEETLKSDFPSTDNALTHDESLSIDIARCLDSLSDRERYIIECWFGLNGREQLSIKEIAMNLGLTGMRIRQIYNEIRKQMQTDTRFRHLRSYLDCA